VKNANGEACKRDFLYCCCFRGVSGMVDVCGGDVCASGGDQVVHVVCLSVCLSVCLFAGYGGGGGHMLPAFLVVATARNINQSQPHPRVAKIIPDKP